MVGRLAIGQALAGLGTLHVVEPELGADLHAPPLKQVRRVGTGTRLQLVDSISAAHRAAGLELDTKAREIRAAMKGNRKTYSTPQAQAEALKPAIVRGILATLGDSPLERRDAALAALLFAGALRRSELAGLDYAQPGDGDGYLRLGSEAVEIILLRSKARTEPATVLVPRENAPSQRSVSARLETIHANKPQSSTFPCVGPHRRLVGHAIVMALIFGSRILR